jgi:hypothetical protein
VKPLLAVVAKLPLLAVAVAKLPLRLSKKVLLLKPLPKPPALVPPPELDLSRS